MPRKNRTPPLSRTPFLQKGCGTKRRFPSARHAEAQAELQMLEQPHLKLDVYQCDSCHKWHLTSQKPISKR